MQSEQDGGSHGAFWRWEIHSGMSRQPSWVGQELHNIRFIMSYVASACSYMRYHCRSARWIHSAGISKGSSCL